ncbi:hypothetical protein [Halobellus limi]|uniref:Uncharacterized protein n=1 Tax=Halobellus limi TaxID=699433 RepID=A0A1H5ZEF7_9EURY|nr:hypothetical protein [Halobellus limi]QCC48117.1 hypothetical protein DV707_10835 [Halobellus limi]SEG34859.1 hypothetical protein SAMN04488133_1970 [Halobellus limi]
MFDENEEEPTITPDGDNATKFHPDEAHESAQSHYRVLARYNSGIYTRGRTDQEKIRRIDNLAVFDAIAGQLELTDWQKRYGRSVVDNLNLREIGHPVEAVVFAVCALTVRRDRRYYNPDRSDENNDSEFLRLKAELDLSDKKIRSLIHRLIPLFPEWVNNE